MILSFWWRKQRIQAINLLLSEGDCRFTRSRKNNSCKLYRSHKERCYALFKKRFKVALGCMAIRTQTELMIRRVQFIKRTKEAATQAACAGNTRGHHSEYGNSWFNNRENDDAYYMFRSYNNCYSSSKRMRYEI